MTTSEPEDLEVMAMDERLSEAGDLAVVLRPSEHPGKVLLVVNGLAVVLMGGHMARALGSSLQRAAAVLDGDGSMN